MGKGSYSPNFKTMQSLEKTNWVLSPAEQVEMLCVLLTGFKPSRDAVQMSVNSLKEGRTL